MSISRREFLNGCVGAGAVGMIPGCSSMRAVRASGPLKKDRPAKALVAWYSQTGHTKLYGRIIAKEWARQGLETMSTDIRDIDRETLSSYDLMAIGTPVFYYDMPVPVKDWLQKIPEIKGTAVASFVSYGGPGGNVHNTGVAVLDLLTEKGGVPIAMGSFGNMGAFPPDWAGGKTDNVLKHRHLPDEGTFEAVRVFADDILKKVQEKKPLEVSGTVDPRDLIKGGFATWSIKALSGDHTVDTARCVKCGVCLKKCPVGAINIREGSINSSDCVLCFGCINNCPVQAHEMTFMGKKMYGFNELLKQNHITILEPAILKS